MALSATKDAPKDALFGKGKKADSFAKGHKNGSVMSKKNKSHQMAKSKR